MIRMILKNNKNEKTCEKHVRFFLELKTSPCFFLFFFAFFVSLFTNQQRQGDDSTKEWYMGDGGLLDNGGLPDAIRRGAECTVALGTEKS